MHHDMRAESKRETKGHLAYLRTFSGLLGSPDLSDMLGHLVSAEWTLLTVDGGPRGGGVTSRARLELETRWMESEFVAGPILEKFNYNTTTCQYFLLNQKPAYFQRHLAGLNLEILIL